MTILLLFFRATLPISASHDVNAVEDKTATLTLNSSAEADQWLRDNGVLPVNGNEGLERSEAAALEELADVPSRPPRRRERKKSTPPSPKMTSNGLPPTPKVHMGACFSKVSFPVFSQGGLSIII